MCAATIVGLMPRIVFLPVGNPQSLKLRPNTALHSALRWDRTELFLGPIRVSAQVISFMRAYRAIISSEMHWLPAQF